MAKTRGESVDRSSQSRDGGSGAGRSSRDSGRRQPSLAAAGSKQGQGAPGRGARTSRAADGRAGTLHVVATPIGNARDITLRALDMLGSAALIACEDTRVTGKLLAMHGLKTPMVSYHEHNAGQARPRILEKLKSGFSVALVSDAGTPLISDPGYKLVEACIEEGIHVTALPGPSSVLCALALAGLPTDRFMFAGFPPSKSSARRQSFHDLAVIPASLVFLESTKRLAASLADMAAEFGPRPAAVMREMTKVYEETRRGGLDELAAHYADAGPPKGEVVVVVGPPDAEEAEIDDDALDALLRDALDAGTLRDAVRSVTAETGLSRSRVYDRAVALKDGG
ncbi:MAG: 16S rRNA (cytidine(1402)-2'-O)-methyltransferase [Rhodospirillales bacterium]